MRVSRRLLIGGAALTSVALGIAIGLVITWVFLPVQFTNADPVDLRLAHKEDYLRMISAAYNADGNLDVAKQRLNQLGLGDPNQTINDLIAREKASPNGASLAALAQALSAKPGTIPQRQTPGANETHVVILASPTEPVPAFALIERTPLGCAEEPEIAHLRFFVRNTRGRDVPNIGIQIRWANGEETVYTGLKPERGVGYADLEVLPGNYTITLLNAQSATVSDLKVGEAPANCRNDRGATPRGWKLVFQEK